MLCPGNHSRGIQLTLQNLAEKKCKALKIPWKTLFLSFKRNFSQEKFTFYLCCRILPCNDQLLFPQQQMDGTALPTGAGDADLDRTLWPEHLQATFKIVPCHCCHPPALPLQTEKAFKAETSPHRSEGKEQSHWLGWNPALLPWPVAFKANSVLFIGTFQWGKRLLQAGAGSLPSTSAVIRLYSSGFRKQKHVYYQATNQTDINLVKAKLKQSFGIIFWFRSHLLSWCKYFLQIMLKEW